jgi:asparagine synthase (glutamine-hydrolysing)
MTDVIAHRGPDDEGFYCDGEMNLAMKRLAIVDLKARQPVHNENETIWVVFNGEIYNHAELRDRLEKLGHRFYTDHSDTEVIVHIYEEDISFPMNGMFTFALWNKEKERLLLVRDRFGVKPLFYALVDGQIVFASEIKAILAYPKYQKRMNYEAVYHYFTFKNISSPMTAFEGIYAVRPGGAVVFENGKIEKMTWYKLNFAEDNCITEKEAAAQIIYLLEEAVKSRMQMDVPFGAYLSGGVDSSAVVALMSRHSTKPIRTFCLGYEDELKNKEADIYHARRVAKVFGTDHHEYIMSAKELIEDIDNVVRSFDQPFSGTISTYFLTKLISKHVKVALSGDGADELFGSYLSHRLAQEMHDRGQNESAWRYDLTVFKGSEKQDLLSEEFVENRRQERNTQTSFTLLENCFSSLSGQDPLNRILEMEWNTQLPDQVLAFVDFLSMTHSVEIRSPFLDYRLVEFVASLPGLMKIKNGRTKHILKEAVKGLLPEGIVDRLKEGFVLPIYDWLQNQLEGYVADSLAGWRLKKHGLFNVDIVKEILNRYYSGDRQLAAKIWNLVMFQKWWEVYFG